jgi:hypothetical protein
MPTFMYESLFSYMFEIKGFILFELDGRNGGVTQVALYTCKAL